MRMALTSVMVTSLLAAAPASAEPASTCPPACNRIPESAWIAPAAVPFHSVYAWPQLSGLAVTARQPRFAFEVLCGTPAVAGDPRAYVVAERSEVSSPDGEWHLRAQILHWRGETWRGGQDAATTFAAAVSALAACQETNATASASLTVEEPDRLAAAVSGPVVMHEYLVADPVTSTVTELALWSQGPARTSWPAVTDTAILEAMAAPLCTAYIGSCA